MKLSEIIKNEKKIYENTKLNKKVKEKLSKYNYKKPFFLKAIKYFSPVIAAFAIFVIYNQLFNIKKENKIENKLIKENYESDEIMFSSQSTKSIEVATAKIEEKNNYLTKQNILIWGIVFVIIIWIIILFLKKRRKKN